MRVTVRTIVWVAIFCVLRGTWQPKKAVLLANNVVLV